jgi:hypothetical protein
MDWAKWVIPLIAVVVWILANLARLPKEMPRPPVRKPPLPPREGQPKSEVERFLEEVSRRRRQPAERKPVPKQGPPPIELPEELRRREEVRRREEALARRSVPAPAPTPRQLAEKPRQTPVQTKVEVAAVPQPGSTVEAVPVPKAAAATLAPPVTTVKPPAVPARVLSLLRDPASLPAAFLLQEIFRPPLCQRQPQHRRRVL